MSWSSILKTAIVGTERSPLPESELAPLGLPLPADAAQAALEALTAANLLRKAGFQLAASPTTSFSMASQDNRAVCSPHAAQDLGKILSGLYPDALPEFLHLLAQNNLRLPPESLPDLLEKAERDAALAEKIRPALGPRGEWLARQNPRWSSILADEPADWFTASFIERKQLLAQTRARNPLLALAWLEKTWQEEKPAHRAQFIEILSVRLSPMDEDLLEKAFSEKSREVRWAAIQLLALLPESKKFAEANAFFQDRLAPALTHPGRESFLKKSLPDISEDAVQPWLALLLANAKGTGWRNELLHLFVSILPPAELLSTTGLSHEQMLQSLDDAKGATALLEAVVRHADPSWAEPVLRHFSRDFRHAIWQSRPMMVFLTLFAPETMAFLQKNNIALRYENERILRGLENYRQPWPKDLLNNLFEQYRRSTYKNSSEIPGWHYTLALQVAAYHCLPTDAAGCAFVRDYLQNPPSSRPREFEAFLGILRFRQEMHRHLGR